MKIDIRHVILPFLIWSIAKWRQPCINIEQGIRSNSQSSLKHLIWGNFLRILHRIIISTVGKSMHYYYYCLHLMLGGLLRTLPQNLPVNKCISTALFLHDKPSKEIKRIIIHKKSLKHVWLYSVEHKRCLSGFVAVHTMEVNGACCFVTNLLQIIFCTLQKTKAGLQWHEGMQMTELLFLGEPSMDQLKVS